MTYSFPKLFSNERKASSDVDCVCASAMRDEIRVKGFPYHSSVKMTECQHGASAEWSFVESCWTMMDVRNCPIRQRRLAAFHQKRD